MENNTEQEQDTAKVPAVRTNYMRMWTIVVAGLAGLLLLLFLVLLGLYALWPEAPDLLAYLLLIVPCIIFFYWAMKSIRYSDIPVVVRTDAKGIHEQPEDSKHPLRSIRWNEIEDMRELYDGRRGGKPYFRIRKKGSSQSLVVRSFVSGDEAYQQFVSRVKEGVLRHSRSGTKGTAK